MKTGPTRTATKAQYQMVSMTVTHWSDTVVVLMAIQLTQSSYQQINRSCCLSRTRTSVNMCEACALQRNGSTGIAKIGFQKTERAGMRLTLLSAKTWRLITATTPHCRGSQNAQNARHTVVKWISWINWVLAHVYFLVVSSFFPSITKQC